MVKWSKWSQKHREVEQISQKGKSNGWIANNQKAAWNANQLESSSIQKMFQISVRMVWTTARQVAQHSPRRAELVLFCCDTNPFNWRSFVMGFCCRPSMPGQLCGEGTIASGGQTAWNFKSDQIHLKLVVWWLMDPNNYIIFSGPNLLSPSLNSSIFSTNHQASGSLGVPHSLVFSLGICFLFLIRIHMINYWPKSL